MREPEEGATARRARVCDMSFVRTNATQKRLETNTHTHTHLRHILGTIRRLKKSRGPARAPAAATRHTSEVRHRIPAFIERGHSLRHERVPSAMSQATGSLSTKIGWPVAFLLDIDGTLLHTDHLYRKVFHRLLTPLGYEVDDAFYTENVLGKVDADVFSKLMPAGTSKEELLSMSARKDACFVELFWDHTHANGEPQMIVGLKDALATAQQLGIRCIAVTNAQRGAAEASIAALRECIPAASIIEASSLARSVHRRNQLLIHTSRE